MSLILTKWHKYLMGIRETLLPEKRILIRPLSVLWFLLRMLFPLVTFTFSTLWNWVNRRETCQFKCFIASFNLFKVLQGSFQNKYWHMLTFPTGKYRLLLYYPSRTFHFPRATGKRNSRPLRWDLSSCQVSCNSIQRFQRRSRKYLSQSEARTAILFFRSARKTQTL